MNRRDALKLAMSVASGLVIPDIVIPDIQELLSIKECSFFSHENLISMLEKSKTILTLDFNLEKYGATTREKFRSFTDEFGKVFEPLIYGTERFLIASLKIAACFAFQKDFEKYSNLISEHEPFKTEYPYYGTFNNKISRWHLYLDLQFPVNYILIGGLQKSNSVPFCCFEKIKIENFIV